MLSYNMNNRELNLRLMNLEVGATVMYLTYESGIHIDGRVCTEDLQPRMEM